ncbi:uncharacterized protein LOC129567007 [Sitodiplosis mosellana]|uniref:uncharacterized protein LOC129567007 n=1 Tax=Sitodiplosis mosellana TaxID=263140 RepID=UPI0024440E15|nr:uncharacterized protein LOC129567007 [Sitodiplosis mosellana]
MYIRHFLVPPSLNMSIALSIYCQKMMRYPAGYGLAVCEYIEMAVTYITGQNVIDRNERILRALYDFKWYLLPIDDQKDLMHMMIRFQNEATFTIGPFEELNYETIKLASIFSFI